MANNLGSLVVSLGLDAAEFTRGLTKSEYQTQQTMRKIGAAVASVSGLIGGISLAGITAMVTSVNDGVDALNDLKDATGASVENISALEDVALRTGTKFETVTAGLIKFNGVLKDAKPGSEAATALERLGLSVDELRRLDPAEALRQTSVALTGFADDGDRARLVQELFGKSTKEVAAFLKDLSEQGELVAKVTTKQAEEAEKFNKELFAMEKNAKDVARALTGPLIESLNSLIAKFREGRAAGESFFETAARVYANNVREIYGIAPKSPGGGATGDFSGGALDRSQAVLNRQSQGSFGLPGVGSLGSGGKGNKAADAALRDAKRLREEDLRGWVAYADAVLAEGERQDAMLRQIDEDANRYREQMRQKDLEGWVAYAEARVNEDFETAKALADSLSKSTDAAVSMAKQLSDAFAGTFDRAFRDGMKFGDLLKKLAFDAINIQFLTPSIKKGSDFLGGLLGKVFSFAGGGYTGSGSRSGGLDGQGGYMAMLHPQETVVDHTRPGSAGNGVVIHQSVSIDARGADAGVEAKIRAAMEQTRRQTIAEVQALANRGGSFSRAMGRA